MKKLLLCLTAITSFTAYSQLSMQVSTQGNNVSPNGTVTAVTTASGNTKVIFDIKNTSNSNKSFNVKRYDVLLHTAGASTASAYFCFAGSCYGAQTMVSPASLSLSPGQSASQVPGSFNMLTTDLDEANTVGLSLVKYTFFNINQASDSLQVTVAYNQPTGVNEITNLISAFDLFPNPVNETATIRVTSFKALEGKFCIYNTLGAIVSEKSITLTEGKNKIDFNAETLPSGIYFANLKFGNSSTTKKFIVK
jgi:hypothetical protein